MGVFAYRDADTDSILYHVVPSPDSAPSDIYSETESAVSGTTIESDDLPGYFVLHHGRQQPASDNVVKCFPHDNIRRHVIWYHIAKYLFGGDYVGPVKDILAPADGRPRRALELGTKAGTWIQAMATQFPHVQFHTIDIVPVVPHVPRRNVLFEVYDFTEGLLLEDESQDAVFLNMILEMVKDYRALLREVQRVIRPGGLVHIKDYSPNLWDPDNITTPVQRGPQGFRLTRLVQQHISALGIDPPTCEKIPGWLLPDSTLWTEDQRGFIRVQSVLRTHAVYPHDGFPCAVPIGAKMSPYLRNLTETSTRDMLGLVQDAGLEEKEARELIENTIEELRHHENCALFKVYCICATKV